MLSRYQSRHRQRPVAIDTTIYAYFFQLVSGSVVAHSALVRRDYFNRVDKFNSWCYRSELTKSFSAPSGEIKRTDGSDDFPQHWLWCNGDLSRERDGERLFPYLHFICWKRNQGSQLTKPDPFQVKRLTAGSACSTSVTGFASGEL